MPALAAPPTTRVPRPAPEHRTDAALAARARAGDRMAFEAIFRRHHPPLLSYCRHMLGGRDEAEDALQQTFIRAHRALLGGTVPRELRPWLYGIAGNCCRTLAAERRPVVGLEAEDPGVGDLGEEVARREDLRNLVRDLSRLPEDQRSALLLSELEDRTHVQIAEILGCRAGKVKALVYQARSALLADRRAREASCIEIREDLAVARGGELRRGPLRRHLGLCPGCRDFQAAIGDQRRSLALVLPVVATAGLGARVLAHVGPGHAVVGLAGAAGAQAGLTGAAGVGSGVSGAATAGGGLAGIGAATTPAAVAGTAAAGPGALAVAGTAAAGPGALAGLASGLVSAGSAAGAGTGAAVGGGILAKLAVGGAVASLAAAGALTVPHSGHATTVRGIRVRASVARVHRRVAPTVGASGTKRPSQTVGAPGRPTAGHGREAVRREARNKPSESGHPNKHPGASVRRTGEIRWTAGEGSRPTASFARRLSRSATATARDRPRPGAPAARDRARPGTPAPRARARPGTPAPRDRARPGTPAARDRARPRTPAARDRARALGARARAGVVKGAARRTGAGASAPGPRTPAGPRDREARRMAGTPPRATTPAPGARTGPRRTPTARAGHRVRSGHRRGRGPAGPSGGSPR
jgi:RNA polymerase sigma factor (sigma-70 family)